jgi:phosphoesterase RecJ-like protein
VELLLAGQAAILAVPQALLRATDTGPGDCAGLVNFLRRLRGVRVAALLREEGPGAVKLSLRSYGTDDVQAVAAAFGGGGHKNAAGAVLSDSLEGSRKRVVEALAARLLLDTAPGPGQGEPSSRAGTR